MTGARRYAHASCALRQKEEQNSNIELEIIDPNDTVLCCFCKKPLSRSSEDCHQINNSRYAHTACKELEDKREKTDAEKLDEYIMNLFNYDYVPPRAKKQIAQFIKEYNYTYSGMLKALVYFYEIKGGSKDDAHDGIGILPYIYNDAYNYYYNLWLANQKNEDKDMQQYVPRVIEVRIEPPQREVYKRKLFTFLDEEEVEDGE